MQAMKRVDGVELYRKFISQQVRPDGRTLTKHRKITISAASSQNDRNHDNDNDTGDYNHSGGPIGTSNGSSIVRIGSTSVVCGIKAEIADPLVSAPRDGHMVTNVELSSLCSPLYRPGPPPDQAQVLSETLSKTFLRYFFSCSFFLHRPSSNPSISLWPLDLRCWIYLNSAFLRARRFGCFMRMWFASMMTAMFSMPLSFPWLPP